jgi:D-alanine-D-alanine ligase
MKNKINVAILFGGKSVEHEVSLHSGKNIFNAIDKEKYNPILIGISKTGEWLMSGSPESLINADDPKSIKLNQDSDPVVFVPQGNGRILNLKNIDKSIDIDVVFPILHGTLGEDGSVQGLLKIANVPFVGASVLGSAVGMDKDFMKRLLSDAKIPIGKFVILRSKEETISFQELEREIGVPFFVKPASSGSSVGISKIHNESEYLTGLKKAFNYDSKIVIEEYIKGREIECSVLGNDNPIASIPGEVIPSHEFYSYEAKYIDEKGAKLEIPANLSKEKIAEVQELSIKTFQVLDCQGLARVDFFLKDDGTLIVNEINTIPGFTRISMYPKMWEATGISYTELITRLISLAIERFEKEQELKTNYCDDDS